MVVDGGGKCRARPVNIWETGAVNCKRKEMPDAKDVILKHIAAFNDRDYDAEPWAADAEMAAPGAHVSGRDDVNGFLGAFHEAFPDGSS